MDVFSNTLKKSIMVMPALTKTKKIGSQAFIFFFVNLQLPISHTQVVTLISRKTQRRLWSNFMKIC